LAEIAFSGRQNADNLLTRSLVLAEKFLPRNLSPLKRKLHDWAKSHFQASKMNIPTLRGTLKRWFNESAAIAFSVCQNTENLITRNLLHAQNLLTRSLVTLKRGFHD